MCTTGARVPYTPPYTPSIGGETEISTGPRAASQDTAPKKATSALTSHVARNAVELANGEKVGNERQDRERPLMLSEYQRTRETDRGVAEKEDGTEQQNAS